MCRLADYVASYLKIELNARFDLRIPCYAFPLVLRLLGQVHYSLTSSVISHIFPQPSALQVAHCKHSSNTGLAWKASLTSYLRQHPWILYHTLYIYVLYNYANRVALKTYCFMKQYLTIVWMPRFLTSQYWYFWQSSQCLAKVQGLYVCAHHFKYPLT